MKAWIKNHQKSVAGVLLSTAHPAKFTDVVSPAIDTEFKLPQPLAEAYRKEKNAVPLSNRYDDLKAFLLKK